MGSTMRRGLAVVTMVLVAGCGFSRPSLRYKAVAVKEVSLEGATLEVTFTLKNPNPMGLSLVRVDYALAVEGHPVLSGAPPAGLHVPAKGATDLVFPTVVRFEALAPVLTAVLTKPEASYRASGHVGVRTPLGIVSLPLSHEGRFPMPRLPRLEVHSASLGALSFSGAQVVLPVEVENPNAFPIPPLTLQVAVTLAGAEVGEAAATLPTPLGPGEKQVVQVPVSVNFLQSGTAVSSALRARRAQVRLDGELRTGRVVLPVHIAQEIQLR